MPTNRVFGLVDGDAAWWELPPMAVPRLNACMAPFAGSLLAIGGCNDPNAPVKRCDYGLSLGSFRKPLERCSEVLAARSGPKTQPISVGMFHGLPSRPCRGSSEEMF